MSKCECNSIANNINHFMQVKGYSQKQLAYSIDITESAMSRYLNGEREPKISVIKRIAKVLDVPIDRLCDRFKDVIELPCRCVNCEHSKKTNIEYVYVCSVDTYYTGERLVEFDDFCKYAKLKEMEK